MKEIKDILLAFDKAQKQGKKAALATVVHVEGSSYRRAGARMLITEDGQLTGAISGGCLEGDALRKALMVMSQQKSTLVTYDTMDEDDETLGVGLGCNGIIQVLIEPIDPSKENNAIFLLKEATSQRQSSVLVTFFSLQDKKNPQPGTCLLFKEGNSIIGQAPLLNDILIQDARDAFQHQSVYFKNYISEKENYTAFIEFLKPPISLIIIGAGNDIMPLVQMADILGWESTIVDGRPSYAKRDRFISACNVIVSKPGDVLNQLTIDDQTAFLLMTHNYKYDLDVLRTLLTRKVAYIGSLGPRKKMNRMLDELKNEGITLTDQPLSSIYGPVGLDIGAETPEEIALSILAEIKSVFSSRRGQSLKTIPDVIHPRSESAIEQVRLNKQ